MPPDDVVEDVADVGRLVEGADDGADRLRADRMSSLDELDQLVDDDSRRRDRLVLAVEGEPVPAQRDRAAEPFAQRDEHAVTDARELGGDLVRDGDHVLHASSVGAAGYGAPVPATVAVGVLDRDRWDANTDNLAVVDPGRRRVTWVPRDLWCVTLGDRVNAAFSTGGLPLLLEALAEHGFHLDGAVVLRRGATERLLDGLRVTVPVPRPLRFLYPLAPTSLVQDGAKLIRFDPPTETLEGERLHQWVGARKVPTGSGSDLHRIRRQQVALRAVLEAGSDLSQALADPSLLRASGAGTLATLGRVRPDWSFETLDRVVPRTIDGKAVLVRDRGPGAPLRALRRALGGSWT